MIRRLLKRELGRKNKFLKVNLGDMRKKRVEKENKRERERGEIERKKR